MAQCPSCRFENMPQYTTCVRCGSLLPGSDTPVKIAPPRAGRLEKALRLASVIRILNLLGGRIGDAIDYIRQKILGVFQIRVCSADLEVLPMFWKGIVPGLAQWYIGRKPHEMIFFFGWLFLLLLTFLTFGLPISAVLLGLAISFHLSSILDIVIITCRGLSDRIFLFTIMVVGAILLFYIPTSTLCWNHLGAQGLNGDAGPLRNGDALLYTMSRSTIKPKIGDLVLYMAPIVSYPSPGLGHLQNQLQGNMFDRVLALEGQTISWHNGALTVDGNPSRYQPFVPISKPPDGTFVVPEGQCYIVPGVAFRRLQMPADLTHWSAVGLVPCESIYGVVWGVRRSLFHFVDIHPTDQLEGPSPPNPIP